MLTGDKGETARMIGISCGLLTCPSASMEAKLIKFEDDIESIEALMNEIDTHTKFELMISGRVLSQLLMKPELKADLNTLLSKANAVLVFRASPAQKADVVHFIRRNNRNKITVSIGDGANDVNMI